jgi:hypothetical protein
MDVGIVQVRGGKGLRVLYTTSSCTMLFHYHVCIAELDGTCRRALGIFVVHVYNCILIISCFRLSIAF